MEIPLYVARRDSMRDLSEQLWSKLARPLAPVPPDVHGLVVTARAVESLLKASKH